MRRTERGQIDETKSFLSETRLDIEIAAEDMDESGVDFVISDIPKAIHFFLAISVKSLEWLETHNKHLTFF